VDFQEHFFDLDRSELRKRKGELLSALVDHKYSEGFTLILSYLYNEYKIALKDRSGLDVSNMDQVSKNCHTLLALENLIRDLQQK